MKRHRAWRRISFPLGARDRLERPGGKAGHAILVREPALAMKRCITCALCDCGDELNPCR